MKCRDFFNEICLKQWTGLDYSIYRFTTKNCPIFDNKQRPYLICYNFPEDIKNYLKVILSSLDSRIKWINCKEAVIIKLPLYYIKYTFLMSYVTFLIRCVERFEHKCTPMSYDAWSGNEKNYASSITFSTQKNMMDMFEAVRWITKNYKKLPKDSCNGTTNNVDTHTLHSSSGIVGTLCNKQNKIRQLCEQYWTENA